MNGASATAFLPNFVGFPSPRGLHSSTVQPRSAPLAHTCAFTPPLSQRPSTSLNALRHPPGAPCTAKRPPEEDFRRTLVVPDGSDAVPRPELSCPVSAASAASAPTAPAPAGRPASAGRTTAAGRTPVEQPPPPPEPEPEPEPEPPPPPAVPGPARTPRAAAPRSGHDRQDGHRDECHQDDASDHGATLLPFPRSGPPWALLLAGAFVFVSACSSGCTSCCSSCCFPACASCVKGGCPRVSRTKAELSNSRG